MERGSDMPEGYADARAESSAEVAVEAGPARCRAEAGACTGKGDGQNHSER
jgi:hypothetical protein